MNRAYEVTLTRIVHEKVVIPVDAANGRDAAFKAAHLEHKWEPVSEKITVESAAPA